MNKIWNYPDVCDLDLFSIITKFYRMQDEKKYKSQNKKVYLWFQTLRERFSLSMVM